MYTVADLVLANAHTRPDNAAVIDGTDTISYGQLADRAEHLARRLQGLLTAGSRVVLLLPRSADTLAAYFAAHLAGLVPVIAHEQLRTRQIAHIVDHAEAGLALTTARLATRLNTCLPLKRILTVPDLAASPQAPQPVRPRVIGRDLAGLIYTSGSTGRAKGVMLSHDNLLAGAEIVADYLELTPKDRTLALMPLSFDYGLNQVLATFHAGGTVVIQRSAFAPDICHTLVAHEVTGLAGVPTLWSDLLRAGSPFATARYPSLRYLTNTGGALTPAAVQAIRSAQPQLAIFAMYGLTEAFRSTYLAPDRLKEKPTSVGRAIPDSQVDVVDEEGRPCPPGEVGEVVHRGPTVALGYWRDPEATARVFRPRPGLRPPLQETVVYSGDLGYTDAEGDLYITGRRDEQTKIHGIRVTPTEVETEVSAAGLTAAAIAVFVADPSGASEPRLLLAVQPRESSFRVDALHAYCAAELPPHMRPRRIEVLDELPRTPHGKPDRQRIRALLTSAGADR
ncbi:AMP-binding protein [Streptomyces sp. SAI-090]|jgi:amino acid adenylation domain-containing protein|uniref:AMP-binding protein n=1 Tax=Streptomyces sp. SAI-090 TaxID=2940545 RepID=UPI002476B316|nr:AMP-binding protein [Streptomyces sp. SAI-090]MDH6522335.1 amino acid adenylation domain-containing protein [Streptomyces sp. SAI-090]